MRNPRSQRPGADRRLFRQGLETGHVSHNFMIEGYAPSMLQWIMDRSLAGICVISDFGGIRIV